MATEYRKNSKGVYEDWEAYVEYQPYSDSVKVWIIQKVGNSVLNASIGKNGYIKMTALKEGVNPEHPLLEVNNRAWYAISQALSEITPSIKQEEVDAELKATKFHLEDMRKLVFKNKTNGTV